ncbi:MAG: SPOR domain-containing protein [Treponema sp.]
MIKKTFTVISMFLFTTTLMWAVWEGNAAAGSNDEFPAGLFAYSTLLPKHTLIEVLNLENNRSSRAVIIGNTGTDGLIIKMSPDLAAALAVRIGNTVRIRLSVPAHVAETGADPVLIAKNPDIPLSVPPVPVEEPAPSVEDTVVSKQPAAREESAGTGEMYPAPKEVASVPERRLAAEMPPAPPEEVEPPVRPLDSKVPESLHPVAEIEAPLQPEPAASHSDTSAVAAAQPVQESPAEREADILPVTETAVPVNAEPVLAETIPPVEVEEPADHAENSSIEAWEPVAEVEEPRTPAAPLITETMPAEVEPVAEPELYEAYHEIPESLALEDEKPAQESADDIPAAEEPADTAGDTDTYATLAETLPVEEAAPEEKIVAAVPAQQTVMLIPVAPKEPEGEDPVKTHRPHKPVPQSPAPDPFTEKTLLETGAQDSVAGTLKPGAFYVQIGNFTDSLNVQSFIGQYGKQYPVAVEKSETGHSAFYRVYIGPLKKDERGAALETFHKLGFKDAFLKKVR